MDNVVLTERGSVLTLGRGTKSQLKFHAIWLRDNAWDEKTRSAGNGQRLIALRDIPKDTFIETACIKNDKVCVVFQPENKTVEYSLDWLKNHAYANWQRPQSGWVQSHIETWDATLMGSVPQASLPQVQDDHDKLANWLSEVKRYGFGKLVDGPTRDQSLMQVVDLFGYVRETNYGRNFEVRTEVNPSNLAYTGLGLQAHTDNPYRDPVPTIQVLYCLESSAAGGENMVVDGFKAVERLREENSQWFEVLSSYCANFEYAGEKGVTLRSRRPMIELSADGELIGVRFNNRSAAAITDVPFDDMPIYYEAYRRLGEIIDDPAMEVTFRLEPGECFIVDNTRILHARKAYSGVGKRWLQGCYADKDGLYSTLASLRST